MKRWVDDVRSAPDGYVWVKSVNEAISWIQASDRLVRNSIALADGNFVTRGYQSKNVYIDRANRWTIELIDLDHDAGDYAEDGGDYIKILDWLEATGRCYPIRIHSMNPVGVENMRRIIQRNKWEEIR